MSGLKEQLIKLGAVRKGLRPHIRPVLATLEKSASRGSWNARLMNAKSAFARETLDHVERGFPKVVSGTGIHLSVGHAREEKDFTVPASSTSMETAKAILDTLSRLK